jgi:TDG/mug DNA glycosylase family protein
VLGSLGAVPRFTRAELETFRDAEVPDLLGPEVRLLFVGINPGLWTAATQTHFAHPVNRFYPALHLAGIVERRIDPAAGMDDADREHLRGRGIAITNLVRRATARADELSAEELRAGGQDLLALVERIRPRVVAIAGITAYRTAFGQRKAVAGHQPELFGGAELWVVPNPSGLNAHHTVATLAEAYAEPARAAGILPAPDQPSAPRSVQQVLDPFSR